jgi:acetyltransferase
MRPEKEVRPEARAAHAVVAAALCSRRTVLTETETSRVLAAYGLPALDWRVVPEASGLAAAARAAGYPVALKILSVDILHKSDVAGIALGVATPGELEQRAREMLRRCAELQPLARIDGFAVQSLRMVPTRRLYAGIAVDRGFGPVVVFGPDETRGASRDRTLGLPPPDSAAARALMLGATTVHPLWPGALAGLPGLESVLVKLGQLALDVPQIAQLDVEPLLVDGRAALAIDAVVRIAASDDDRQSTSTACPAGLEEQLDHHGRRLLLRPVRPEDAPLYREFLAQITKLDLYRRFFTCVRQFPETTTAHFTQIDYRREMAFVAVSADQCGPQEMLAVAQVWADATLRVAEFAVLVRSDLKGQGLGRLLLRKLLDYCRMRGMQRLHGYAMVDNAAMARLGRELGFRQCARDGNIEEIALTL